MASVVVKKSVTGAATGSAIGSTLPGIGTAIGAAIGTAVGFIAGLFTSKKHYHLYYFEEATDTWEFVIDGIPSQLKPMVKEYTAHGIKTAMVRNKGGKAQPGELAPKNPPAGYTPNESMPSSTNTLMIAAVIGAFVLIMFLILKKRKR